MGTDLLRRANQLVRDEADVADLCRALDAELRTSVPYQAAAWSTHDPATGLTTSCTLTGVPEDPNRESAIFRHEFDDHEPATYLGLIGARRTVAVLSDETAGDLSKAGRWRDVFSRFGVTDELRAILWSEQQPWGSLSLYRLDGRFTPEDVALVGGLAPIVADGLRLSLLRTAASRPEKVQDPPGILEVGSDGRVTPVTVPARHWIEFGGEPLRSSARAAAAALQSEEDWQGATSRMATPDGTVLALYAASTTRNDGTVAVIVEAARPAQVGDLLVDAYGLTSRQRDVLGLLLLGRSMTQIAHQLDLSEHTANDHRKALYRRLNVSSRSELAALLQHEHYDRQAAAGATPSPYGGFL